MSTTTNGNDTSLIYSYTEARIKFDPEFKKTLISSYEKYNKWSALPVRLLTILAANTCKPKQGSIKYFFWGTNYKEIILGLPPKEVCIIGGPQQLLFCIRHNISYIPCFSIKDKVWDTFIKNMKSSHNAESNDILKIRQMFKLKLSVAAHTDAQLYVNNDSLPMQRLIILASREAGVSQSICIQHGLFQSKSPGEIFDGWFSDIFFAISEQQKNLLIEKGMDQHKIKVLGFHSSPHKPTRETNKPEQRTICFLGQPWIKYGLARGQAYMAIVSNLSSILNKHGKTLHYKPHPGELGYEHLENIKHITTKNLNESFDSYDIFISLTSTALFEANQAGRIAIQIYDPAFDADDFSMFKNIHSIENSQETLEENLIRILSSEPPKNIEQQSISEKFISLTGNHSEPTSKMAR